MATIKDVARLAGVSTSTVSRALSRKIRVDEATRARVLQAVASLGYRPNFMAQGLKDGFTRIIALALPDITNPFFPKLVQCVEKRAGELGYSLILCDSGGDPDQELRHIEAIMRHRVDGALYIGIVDRDCAARVGMLRDAGIPAVLVNRDFDVGVDCVTNDNRCGARAMVRSLIRLGHRKISCLAFTQGSQHYRQRFEGCLQAFAEGGIRDYEKYLVIEVRDIDGAYRATRELLARRDRPTAFFAFVDFIAVGVYSGVYDSGLRIPDDVSVVGFDNIDMSKHMFPPLTTYEHPVRRIAETAVDLLALRIKGGGDPGCVRTEIHGGIITGKSVKRIGPCKK